MIQQSNLTPSQALTKIQQFCAYQERSHFETKNKLYSFGLKANDVEKIIATLIEENYLNEERFAILFAGGKFRIKQWGKVKIKYELQNHKVSSYNIKKALQQISDADYWQTIQKVGKKYYSTIKATPIVKKHKTKIYLQQKGFELDIINSFIKELNN